MLLAKFVLTDAAPSLGVHVKGVHPDHAHGACLLTVLFQILYRPCWAIGWDTSTRKSQNNLWSSVNILSICNDQWYRILAIQGAV